MLEVDKNSYIDIDYANNYVDTYYFKYAPLRTIWSVLDDGEKSLYLLNSMRELEALPIAGTRLGGFNQPLQFPRQIGIFGFEDFAPGFGFGFSETVPEIVKQAQIENALGLINAECHAQVVKQFATLSSIGAVKNTKVTKREMSDAMLEGVVGTPKTKNAITSDKALQLLRPYLGGFSLC